MSETTKEGKAEVYLPTSVFYNPVQEFNRDLTTAIISQHARDHFVRPKEGKKRRSKTKDTQTTDTTGENGFDVGTLEAGKHYEDGLRILEGLSASGLRSVRFALEIPGVKEIVANDFDKTAVEFIQKNVDHNQVGHLVRPNCDDAAMVMYQSRKYSDRFHVIDLDPYGSPAQFLDGAVQALADGGLLCVTCTDVAILCGNAPETCYAKYGSMPLKGKYCHEMALRIVLQSIESHANRYSRYIEPLLSISADFYVRLFVRIHTGQQFVKQSVTKMASVYHCTGCGDYRLQPLAKKLETKGDNYKFIPPIGPVVGNLCSECGFKFHVGGPIWAERIHDQEFLEKVISSVSKNKSRFKTSDRIIGVLTVMKEELPDVPLFHVVDHISKVMHCIAPPLLQLRSAFLDAGYDISLSHAAKNSIKTNAPNSIVWDIFRCWIKEHPIKLEKLPAGSPGRKIVTKEPNISVSFEVREDANPKSRQKGLLRWQPNPERDWGPKPRAKKGETETLDDRREKGRNKAKRKANDLQQTSDDDTNKPEPKKPSTEENAEANMEIQS